MEDETIPLVMTPKQVRLVDLWAVEKYGFSSLVLMENAGRSCVERLTARLPDRSSRIVIVCGKGNNGGDGFVIARHLWIQGYRPTTLCFHELQELSPDARANAEILQKLSLPLVKCSLPDQSEWLREEFASADLIVDCLLGTGLSGPLRDLDQQLVAMMNAAAVPIVAIDVPSGLNAETGCPSPIAVIAEETVTLAALKTGLMTEIGQSFSGRVSVGEIGVPRSLLETISSALE